MGFISIPGVVGKVYVPEHHPGKTKKHPCPDCYQCQNCSADRCGLCRDSCPWACGHPADHPGTRIISD